MTGPWQGQVLDWLFLALTIWSNTWPLTACIGGIWKINHTPFKGDFWIDPEFQCWLLDVAQTWPWPLDLYLTLSYRRQRYRPVYLHWSQTQVVRQATKAPLFLRNLRKALRLFRVMTFHSIFIINRAEVTITVDLIRARVCRSRSDPWSDLIESDCVRSTTESDSDLSHLLRPSWSLTFTIPALFLGISGVEYWNGILEWHLTPESATCS